MGLLRWIRYQRLSNYILAIAAIIATAGAPKTHAAGPDSTQAVEKPARTNYATIEIEGFNIRIHGHPKEIFISVNTDSIKITQEFLESIREEFSNWDIIKIGNTIKGMNYRQERLWKKYSRDIPKINARINRLHAERDKHDPYSKPWEKMNERCNDAEHAKETIERTYMNADKEIDIEFYIYLYNIMKKKVVPLLHEEGIHIIDPVMEVFGTYSDTKYFALKRFFIDFLKASAK